MNPRPDNVFAHFLRMLDEHPSRPILTVGMRGKPDQTVTWGELLAMAHETAMDLAAKGVREGETVAIMRHVSTRMVADFLGVILGGCLPCMVAPPNPRMAPEVFRHKLEGMAQASGFRTFLIDPGHPALVAACEGVEGVRIVEGLGVGAGFSAADGGLGTGDLSALRRRLEHRANEAVSSDPLFLQHSSGTSGIPKGVVITHQLILTQLENYGAMLEISEATDRIASWLPLYHDMGMVACLWGGLVWNIHAIHVSNFEWVLEPTLMLDAVARTNATLVWMPNFSFAMLSRIEGWSAPRGDALASVRRWISCSEPVLWPNMAEFVARYRNAGVSEQALHACYAMAENVFAVSQTTSGPPRLIALDREALEKQQRAVPITRTGDEANERLVTSCGHILPGTEVSIIPLGTTMSMNPAPLPPGSLGQILIRGTSRFHRYHGLDDVTVAAVIDGWYHTGDVGFVLDDEVFVTGRCRDLIICGGRNIDPLELETMASEITGVVPGRVCCVGLPNRELGTEDVHLMVEVEIPGEIVGGAGGRDRAGSAVVQEAGSGAAQAAGARQSAISAAVPAPVSAQVPAPVSAPQVVKAIKKRAMELNLPVRQVWCFSRGWLVKSSSGKISRAFCRDKLMAAMGE